MTIRAIRKNGFILGFSKNSLRETLRIRGLKGGNGLGLSIAKALIEKHGGKIDFETEVGRGTTFYFDLPEQS